MIWTCIALFALAAPDNLLDNAGFESPAVEGKPLRRERPLLFYFPVGYAPNGGRAAAAVRCPVVNWISMAGTTDIPNFTFAFFDKPYWEDPEPWLKTSSLMYVGNVTTPTLVMTGEEDLRTPMAQSEEYYAALKVRGVPAKLMRFDSEYHGTGSKPSNAMRTLLYMMSWYNRWTEDGEVETDTDD